MDDGDGAGGVATDFDKAAVGRERQQSGSTQARHRGMLKQGGNFCRAALLAALDSSHLAVFFVKSHT
jgi:hypothetical protein